MGYRIGFKKLAVPLICSSLTYLLNRSLSIGVISEQWKTACIIPINKIPHPQAPADFRSISIIAVLSRAFEKLMVRRYLYFAINYAQPPLSFSDQLAFRPSRSTTSALIKTLHLISTLLKSNQYVHLITLDFSIASGTLL